MGTKATYGTSVRIYKEMMGKFGRRSGQRIRPFPLTEDKLIAFVVLRSEKVKPGTIRKDMCALAAYEEVTVGRRPAKWDLVRLFMKAVKRGAVPTKRKRLPITTMILAKLRRHLLRTGASRRKWYMYHTMVIGVFGLMRAGEFTEKENSHPLLQEDVSFINSRAEIFLRKSKTDQQGKGMKVYLFKTGGKVCPVKSMRWCLKENRKKGTWERAFQEKGGSPLKYRTLLGFIRKAMNWLGLRKKEYATHSLRMGGATSLAIIGVPPWVIMKLGRWRSLAYQVYTKVPLDCLRKATTAMAGLREEDFKKHGMIGGLNPEEAATLTIDQIEVAFKSRVSRGGCWQKSSTWKQAY